MAKQIMKPRRTARLPQAPRMAAKCRKTLIVVADGSRARFFEPSDDLKKLVRSEQTDMTAAEARRPVRDIVTDKPGRGFASGRGGVRHAYEPQHDVHKLQKHNFAVRLAGVLDRARKDGRFDRLVLVAPGRSLGELRTLLSARVRNAVSHEIAKDLTASTPAALRKAVADALPEPIAA